MPAPFANLDMRLVWVCCVFFFRETAKAVEGVPFGGKVTAHSAQKHGKEVPDMAGASP